MSDAEEDAGRKLIDDEAEEEEEEDEGKDNEPKDDADSSEEDLNEPNEYRTDEFLVADDNVEGEEDATKAAGENRPEREEGDKVGESKGEESSEIRKKKKRRPRDIELDEDDLALIEDNLGVKVRKTPAAEGDGLKRLKRRRAPEEEEKTALARELFGTAEPDEDIDAVVGEKAGTAADGEDDDRRPLSPAGAGGAGGVHGGDEEGDEEGDDLADFIVETIGEDGQPVQRRSRPTGGRGISGRALKEASAIFGEVPDFLQEKRRRGDEPEKRDRMAAYREQYEPAVLAERYFTEQDERIRNVDLPEREQLQFLGKEARPELEEGELLKEADWIFMRCFAPRADPALVGDIRTQSLPKILAVLEFMRKDHLEVPFIARYRKDYFQPELEADHLWDILDWDEKWNHLQTRKQELRKLFHAAQEGTVQNDDALALLEASQRDEELNDLADYYQLHTLVSATAVAEAAPAAPGRHKRPVRRDPYTVAKKAGLHNCAKYFGLTAQQFGENLVNDYLTNEPSDHLETPLQLAERYTGSGFIEPDSVLRACRLILAQEIASDPRVRQAFRSIYHAQAEVSSEPTSRGKKEIDRWHPLRYVKRLARMPARYFEGSRFLELLRGEQLELLTKKIEISKDDEEKILHDMERLYLSDRTAAISQQWNEQRQLVLREALGFIFPVMQKELVAKLATDARKRLAEQCGHTLMRALMDAPYREPPTSENGVAVMSCIWGGNHPSVFVALDGEGEVMGTLKLAFLANRTDEHANETERTRRAADIQQLQHFLQENNPSVIAVAAGVAEGGIDAKKLFDLFTTGDFAADHVRAHNRRVMWVDAEVSRIYKNSARAQAEFAEYPPVVRQCISLARRLLEPLAEHCGLFNDQDDILCLKFHPLQDMLTRDELLRTLERRALTAVNNVGVDINRAVLHRWTSHTLQFVAGLGRRKAAHILQQVSTKLEGRVATREQLAEQILTPGVVYINCAGFLRIPVKDPDEDDYEPLDNTRIHPDDYAFAEKMASDALEEPDAAEDRWVVKKLMEHPDKLADVDLDVFASEWERKGKGKKHLILYDIKEELLAPFRDPRFAQPRSELSSDRLFTLLTGENDDTLHVGQIVTVQVSAIKGDRVLCSLDSGLPCFIERSDISDLADFRRLDEKVKVGMVIHARVLEIRRDTFEARLTCKTTELQDHVRWEYPVMQALTRERWLVPDSPTRDAAEPPKKRSQKPPRAKPKFSRIVVHPLFKNCIATEAEAHLAMQEDGEVIFRPSNRSPNHLSLSWKFHGPVLVHFDVLELEKQRDFDLGKKLQIGRELFDDLDEIKARYIDPMTGFVKDVIGQKFFAPGTLEQADERLVQEKRANPRRIPYTLSVSPQFPGRFVLSYLPSNKPKRELVTVTPEGLRFRHQMFARCSDLINWFKAHYREQPHRQQSQPMPMPHHQPYSHQVRH